MAAKKRKRRPRRRRGRFGFLYVFLSILIIFAAIAAGSIAFFRLNNVTVTGNRFYTAEQVTQAAELTMGDNLFLVDRPEAARKIRDSLPYVETVSPVVHLPDTLELRITESEAAATVAVDGEIWLMNSRGKLLESGEAAAQSELPRILGLTPVEPEAGELVQVPEEEAYRLDLLRSFLSAMADLGMTGRLTEFIDLRQPGALWFGCEHMLTVAFSTAEDLAEQSFRFQRVLDTFAMRGEVVSGTLDMTFDTKQARLRTERWLPEDYIPVTPGTEAEVEWGEPTPEDGTLPADPSADPAPEASEVPEEDGAEAEGGEADGGTP